VLSWLLAAQEGETPLSDEEVRDQVVSLVAAGYDTTAAAMGWAIAELANDPTHQTRIREEREQVTSTALITVEQIQKLTYTNAFVSEVLRLHPPAMLSGRRVERPVTLHGFTIPAGRMILYSPYITHRMPELFPDPTAFKPGLWIEGHPDHHPMAPYAYVPFGGGSRRCIGFAFALQELVVMISALTEYADIEPAFEFADFRPTGLVSSRPANGVPIRLQARRN
jgi:cytochrome P450